jgi:hypothetical protein
MQRPNENGYDDDCDGCAMGYLSIKRGAPFATSLIEMMVNHVEFLLMC